MKIAIRADASLQIGTGHVMRCLTLTEALSAEGADCQLICREHSANLIELIRRKGYVVHVLPAEAPTNPNQNTADSIVAETKPAHSHWLGSTQAQDAEACALILAEIDPDWLIVDHYALDARWELALKPHYRKLMVIDDLADRPHVCDVLLDQTFGRSAKDYRRWVPADCYVLCGSQYALLRTEFAALRPYSLRRRAEPQLQRLLITMGGVDKDNATGQTLEALRTCPLPPQCQITVIMGPTAPWLAEIEMLAHRIPWPTKVMVGVSGMAQLMADSDLAIGAAGATSWERCCLGLPSIMLVLADNQRAIAQALHSAGAAFMADVATLKEQQLIPPKQMAPRALSSMSSAAAAITDGLGALRVINLLSQQG